MIKDKKEMQAPGVELVVSAVRRVFLSLPEEFRGGLRGKFTLELRLEGEKAFSPACTRPREQEAHRPSMVCWKTANTLGVTKVRCGQCGGGIAGAIEAMFPPRERLSHCPKVC